MKRIICIGVAALLASCATAPVSEAQGLAAAWASLDAAAKIIDGMALGGTLKGAAASTAADDLQKTLTYLQAATAASKAGDATTAEGEVAQATVLLAEIIAISKAPAS